MVGSPNSFLCTQESFGDFELEFEVKVDEGLNSGVQIRSKQVGGKKDGRVFGPQVEIETSGPTGAESGYIYGEATSHGWLTTKEDLVPHKHFKDGEWNHYRVLAQGPRIQTWINGTQIIDLTHADIFQSHPKGFIGLQVHSIPQGTGPFRVAWKNIRIREIAGEASDQDKAIFLFDGKSLDGWIVPEPVSVWMANEKNGTISRQVGGSYLWTKSVFSDFILDLEFKMSKHCNSGIFFRADPNNPVQGGLEIQIFDSFLEDEQGKHDCGALFDAAPPLVNAVKPFGQWNQMQLRVQGPNVTVQLNDQKILEINLDDWTEAGKNPDGTKNKFKVALKDMPRSGHIGLQDHGHDISFRNLKITDLSNQ